MVRNRNYAVHMNAIIDAKQDNIFFIAILNNKNMLASKALIVSLTIFLSKLIKTTIGSDPLFIINVAGNSE